MSINLQNDVNTESKGIKDPNNRDDLDLTRIDLARGDTPNNIKETCLKLCQDYLAGVWNQQTIDTIDVNRLSGGLTNQLYYCGIIDKTEEESDVPQEAAVLFYGPKAFDSCDNETNERLSDVIIGVMVSENNLGPKLYGIHETGQIQKFYKHRHFTNELQNDRRLVEQIFQSLAQIHAMDVPLKKNTNSMTKSMEKLYREAYERFDIAHQIDEYQCKYLKTYDLKDQMEWTWKALRQADSPFVFTHNDFRSGNLLITEPNNELVVCDFEYGGYGPRGLDFTSIMREWGRKPFDIKHLSELPPPDSVFRPLVEIYVEECIRIKGKSFAENPINSVDHILKECKIFLLKLILFYTLFWLKNDENSNGIKLDRESSMGIAETCFRGYLDIKKKLIDQNIIV